MKFGIVVFPGANCDRDMIHVLKNVMGQNVKEIWHKEEELSNFSTKDCVVLPGGFSYGDYLRTGAIARFSPIMKAVIEYAKNGGRVVGICNGFQILCEAGLLPGVLLQNTNQQYVCKNIYLKCMTDDHFVSNEISIEEILKIPIAHGEGRYYASDNALNQLRENDQIIFKYCSRSGEIDEASNPNGSVENIAGICNRERNVFGMMPHPERAAEEILGNTDGLLFFRSLLRESVVA